MHINEPQILLARKSEEKGLGWKQRTADNLVRSGCSVFYVTFVQGRFSPCVPATPAFRNLPPFKLFFYISEKKRVFVVLIQIQETGLIENHLISQE